MNNDPCLKIGAKAQGNGNLSGSPPFQTKCYFTQNKTLAVKVMLRVMHAPAAMTMVGDDSMASMPKDRIWFLCNVVIARDGLLRDLSGRITLKFSREFNNSSKPTVLQGPRIKATEHYTSIVTCTNWKSRGQSDLHVLISGSSEDPSKQVTSVLDVLRESSHVLQRAPAPTQPPNWSLKSTKSKLEQGCTRKKFRQK